MGNLADDIIFFILLKSASVNQESSFDKNAAITIPQATASPWSQLP